MMALTVVDVPQKERYEARTSDGDLVGYLTYRILGSRLVVLIATQVEPQYASPGVESEIISAAMNDLRQRDRLMLPVSDVLQSFLGAHPEYYDLLIEEPTRSVTADGGDPPVAGVGREYLGDSQDEAVPQVEPAEQSRRRLTSTAVGGQAIPTRIAPTRIPALMVATVVVGVAVAVVALLAIVLLPRQLSRSAWTPVLQDFLKTAYTALAIGALGGMAKLLIDRRKSNEAAAAEVRDRQRSYISSTVHASHDVDNARVLIRANQSVLTWTRVVNDLIVPARTQLRDIAHDLTNWSQAGLPVFVDTEAVREAIENMTDYLWDLIEEHAEHKQQLSEMQRTAEKLDGQERQDMLDMIWTQLRSLTYLEDFVDDGWKYAAYRTEYFRALTAMRESLASGGRSYAR